MLIVTVEADCKKDHLYDILSDYDVVEMDEGLYNVYIYSTCQWV